MMKTHLSFIFAALTSLVHLPVTPAFADPTDHSPQNDTAGDIKEGCRIEGEISIREIKSKHKTKRVFYKCERAQDKTLSYRKLSDEEIVHAISTVSPEVNVSCKLSSIHLNHCKDEAVCEGNELVTCKNNKIQYTDCSKQKDKNGWNKKCIHDPDQGKAKCISSSLNCSPKGAVTERDNGRYECVETKNGDLIFKRIQPSPNNDKKVKKGKTGGHVDSRPRNSAFDIPF